jgi:DNA primase
MAGRIPDNTLDDILSRVNIVEVISGYLPLKKAGRNFKACCPFHHEKTPSFMVSPDRQIFHCFGCGESGNAFKFLMRYERMEFPEAVELLAKKAGVELPRQSAPEGTRDANLTTQLLQANEAACAYYESSLRSPAAAGFRRYLVKRGIKEETAKAFKLGAALERWDGLIQNLREKDFHLSLLEKAGLILSKEGGGFYDRFRNRILFPIVDARGRVLGFGGRVLDDSLPKYINSPETPVYVKGKHLYGLNLAKDSIREKDFAVIVEGYLDHLIPFQEGCKNIVASQGTALTSDQAKLLKRYTENVVMVYDADKAGELAALRSLDIFIEEKMQVRVVSLPKGFDPDSYVRQHGIKAFEEMIAQARDLFDFKLTVLRSRFNLRDIQDKSKAAGAMLETIQKIDNAVLRSEYVRRLAQELDIREEALLAELKKIHPGKSTYPSDAAPLKKSPAVPTNPTEKLLINLMLEEGQLLERIREALSPADFQGELAARIVALLFELTQNGQPLDTAALMNRLEDDATSMICEAAFLPAEMSSEQKEHVVDDCIKRLKGERVRIKRLHLHDRIQKAQQAGDEETLDRLLGEFHGLIKEGKIE